MPRHRQPRTNAAGKGGGNLVVAIMDPGITAALGDSGIDPMRLVIIDGVPCLLNIMFRMLEVRDLAKATGFDGEERATSSASTRGRAPSRPASSFPCIWPRRW